MEIIVTINVQNGTLQPLDEHQGDGKNYLTILVPRR